MSKFSKTDSIDVGFDSRFLDKWLSWERYAWIGVCLVLIAGLSGILGRGPLSKASSKSKETGFEVKYERIARNKTPAMIEIRLPHHLPPDRIRLRLEGELAGKTRIRQIMPQPTSMVPMQSGLMIELPTEAVAANSLVSVMQEPASPGKFRSRVSVENGPSLEFSQIVLP